MIFINYPRANSKNMVYYNTESQDTIYIFITIILKVSISYIYISIILKVSISYIYKYNTESQYIIYKYNTERYNVIIISSILEKVLATQLLGVWRSEYFQVYGEVNTSRCMEK